jgi:hypothetical protein
MDTRRCLARILHHAHLREESSKLCPQRGVPWTKVNHPSGTAGLQRSVVGTESRSYFGEGALEIVPLDGYRVGIGG